MRQVSLLLLKPPPSCLPINNAVIFFRSLKLLIRILTSLFTCMDGCKELPLCCHEFVLESLAFSFCFFVIWALLSRWLFPFSIQSENPILRVCHSFSFCGCIIMSLQSKSIVNNYSLFTNIVVLQLTSVAFLFLLSGENCRKTSLLCFPQHVLRFEELFLPLCWTMFWSSGAILSYEKATKE